MEVWFEREIFNWNKHVASDFEIKKLQRFRFWVKIFTTCQILSALLSQCANFSFIHQKRACFSNVLINGLGSISQVNSLGKALCTPTLINVTRRIKTANPIRLGSSIYVDKECWLTRLYQRLWGLKRTKKSSLISMTHLWRRQVSWSGREPTWSSTEVGYRELWLRRVCTCVIR